MIRKHTRAKRNPQKGLPRWLRSYLFRRRSQRSYIYAAAVVLLLLGAFWAIERGGVLLYELEGLKTKTISVSGIRRISENEILAQAGYAPGTNILSLNLDQTREAIEDILWVRHATIQRVWPNEIVISVVEREPIALARIDSEIFQVDVEGVVLASDALTDMSSPILDGLRVGEADSNEIKINIYREIVETIGDGELSEVHIAESGEVSVVPNDNPILVNLGLTHHRSRWEKYLALSERIREDFPNAQGVDLRFQDQIVIQTGEGQPATNILWGEETRLL
jgi:cell division protein FtsQ